MCLTLALTIGLLTTATAAASAASFLLVNQGDHTVYHLYVSRHSTGDWGPDILGEDVLSPGYQTTISFPDDSFDTCYWDIGVVYEDGHTATDMDEDLCSTGTVYSHY
jgi:hypothetical protein